MATKDSSSPNGLSQPRRIMLWAPARSLSTILCQCLSFVPGMRMFYEPYFAAHAFGPECIALDKDNKYDKQVFQYYHDYSEAERILNNKGTLLDECTDWFSADMCTYDWVKSQLENSSFLDTDVVFCKDAAASVKYHYDKIPEGFQHIFLIRNPYKMLPSWKRVCVNTVLQKENLDDFDYQDIPIRMTGRDKAGDFQDLFDLFSHVKKHYHDNPTIIDADDLQNHTSSILRKLLEDTIGVPYNDSFLTWDKKDTIYKRWVMPKVFGYNSIAQEGAHSKAFTSTCFEPTKEAPSRASLTPDLIEVIDAAMPIYEKLYEMRLKP